MGEQWRQELRECVRDSVQLCERLGLQGQAARDISRVSSDYLLSISPHILEGIERDGPHSALWNQFVPSIEELTRGSKGYPDVVQDSDYSPTPGLIHRYPTKVLLMPTSACGSYCRFCFRRKAVGFRETAMSDAELQAAFDYIGDRDSVEEVILTGGDPLILPDDRLRSIIKSLWSIPTVRIVRVHTRMPIVIPSRVTDDLVAVLSEHRPLYVVVHVNHVSELSKRVTQSLASIVDAGIPCLSQSALLRGVNDSEQSLRNLFTGLVSNRVKPYYLFHSDPLFGLSHFGVTMQKGISLMRALYDRMSGLAYPLYVFNVPGGYGHIIVGPTYVDDLGKGRYLLHTFEGDEIPYEEDSA